MKGGAEFEVGDIGNISFVLFAVEDVDVIVLHAHYFLLLFQRLVDHTFILFAYP